MASAPSYAATPAPWCGQVPASADTSTTSPSNFTILGSAGASGTKISQIDVVPLGTVSAGVVNVFAYDGTAYHLVDGVTDHRRVGELHRRRHRAEADPHL